MKHVKKRNLDSRNPSGKFFDNLEETFMKQKQFINVKKLMSKITDNEELDGVDAVIVRRRDRRAQLDGEVQGEFFP